MYVWSSSYSFLSSSFPPSHSSLFPPNFVCSLFLSSFTLWVCLVLPECASAYDHLPELEQCLRSCIPEENCFSAKGGTYWSPPCSWLDFVCLGFLHISHRCCEFISTVSLLYLETCLADAIHYLWLLQYICLLFLDDSDSWEERVWSICPVQWLSTLQSLTLCALTSCGSLCQSPCTAKRSFSDEGWEMHLAIGIITRF